MDPEKTKGTIYRIVASHSGKVLDFAQVKDTRFRPAFAPNDELVARGIRQLIQFSDHSGDNQRFLLFPHDDGAYVIATRDSGSVIDIAFASTAEDTRAIEFPYNGGGNQSLVLEQDGDETHVMRAKHSGLVLDVFEASRDDRVRVFQHHFKDSANQKFTFEPADSYPMPTKGAVGDPGAPPPASSLTANLPASTDPVLIGEVFLPYFLVGDSLRRETAIQQTPYYRLARHQFWTKASQFNFSGPPQTREFEIKQGLTKEESTQMEDAASLSLTKIANVLSGKEIVDGFTKLISGSLKVTITKKTTESTETTVTRGVTYKGGPEILFAEYVLVDRYTLSRADGVVVKTPWESKNPDVVRQIVFPPQLASNVVARTVKAG